MRKFLLSTLVIFFFILSACAQQPGNNHSPEERVQIQNEWMKENLRLNDGQMKQVEALNQEYAQKMETVKSIDGRFAKLKEAKRISDEKDEKLRKVFSKDQFEVYLAKRRELREKFKEMRKQQQ